MNKAFTANINDQVTARGYLDENDQLIMLEPEGSGGGDLTIAMLTVKSNTLEDDSTVPFTIAVADDDYGCIMTDSLSVGETIKVPLYKGKCLGQKGLGVTLTVESGDASVDDSGDLIITGNCSILVANA